MIAVVSDTHRETGDGLVGRAATAVDAADHVIHAGDFTTTTVLDAFRNRSTTLSAVAGNRDNPGVIERLPRDRTVVLDDAVIAVTHRHRSGATGLRLFGQSQEATLVIFGHTHRASVDTGESLTLLNPGSHTQPRRFDPTHAELELVARGIEGQIVTRDGTILDEFVVPTGNRA